MPKLTITVTDPATIQLLARYRQFIKDEDGARGSIAEVVEGLIVGQLDGHERFAHWRRTNSSGPTTMKNVTLHPTARTVESDESTEDTLVPVRRTA
jgi:hypothetical protein